MRKIKNRIDLNILLLTQIGVYNSLKRKKIKFNPKPFEQQIEKETQNNESEINQQDNLNTDFKDRIDDLIQNFNTQNKINTHSIYKEKQTFPYLIEMREKSIRKPDIPVFKTDLQIHNNKNKSNFHDLNNQFQNKSNIPLFLSSQNTDKYELKNYFFHEKNNSSKTKRSIKIKKRENNKSENETTTDFVNNGLTKTKEELEKTKEELEKKKKEIEEMEKKAKLKEEELKQRIEENKRKEKLKQLELKKQEREEKIKEKQRLKEEKLKEKELRKNEKEEKIRKIKQLKEKKSKTEKPQKEEAKDKIEKEKKGLFKKETIEKEKPITLETRAISTSEKEAFDNEISEALTIIDNLLEKLPEETINEFVKSKDFEIYEKVISKYKK